ncbi:MAG: hypothetical protein Kow00127_15250 [Bacteroidales bacterium]
MSRFTVVILAVLLITGCQQKKSRSYVDDQGRRITETLYSDGTPETKTIRLSDSLTLVVRFDEAGVPVDSSRFLNQKLHGRHYYFDKSSGLIHISHYVNGIQQGVTRGVYTDGKVSYEGYHHNGAKAGAWSFFYHNGLPITYEFYDSTGRRLYFRKYDAEGKVQSIDGKLLIAAHHPKENVLPVNREVTMEIIAAVPPADTISVDVVLFPPEGDSLLLASDNLTSPVYSFSFTPVQEGSHTMSVAVRASADTENKETSTWVWAFTCKNEQP